MRRAHRRGLDLTLLRGALPRGAALGYAPRRGPAREGCSRNPELQGPARAGGGRASIRGRGEGGDGARGVPGPAPLPGAVQPEGPEPLPPSSGRKVTPWTLLTPTKKQLPTAMAAVGTIHQPPCVCFCFFLNQDFLVISLEKKKNVLGWGWGGWGRAGGAREGE